MMVLLDPTGYQLLYSSQVCINDHMKFRDLPNITSLRYKGYRAEITNQVFIKRLVSKGYHLLIDCHVLFLYGVAMPHHVPMPYHAQMLYHA